MRIRRAAKAIFKARPRNQIDRQILERLENFFRNPPPQGAGGALKLYWDALTPVARKKIGGLLDQEITARYLAPETTVAPETKIPVAAPAAQAERLKWFLAIIAAVLGILSQIASPFFPTLNSRPLDDGTS